MRKVLASLALGCALVVTASAAACEYEHQTSASATGADQTAQTQPPSSQTQPASSTD